MESSFVLYGASGHCKVVIDVLREQSVKISAVIDDNPDVKTILGIPVTNSKNVAFDKLNNLILSIGNNKMRKELSEKMQVQYTKAVHPSAILSDTVAIGDGTVVMAGVIINSDVSIGKHCIVNTGSLIEHDCFLDDFVHISPRASLAGNVRIGEGTQVGIGAIIIQGISIGKWVTIGAGAVIINDIPDYAVVVGTPGKIIKYNSEK